VQVRQAEIEEDEVGPTERRDLQTFSGVLGLNHGETVYLKAGAQEMPDRWLIIDQEN
jgi:hypothetical protein